MLLVNQILHFEEQKYEDARNIQYLPSAIFKPKLYIDGNKWCAGYGEMPNGVFGFGYSPQLAMDDFNKSFNETLDNKVMI